LREPKAGFDERVDHERGIDGNQELFKAGVLKRGDRLRPPDFAGFSPRYRSFRGQNKGRYTGSINEISQANRTVYMPSNRACPSGQTYSAALLSSDMYHVSAADLCVALAIAFFQRNTSPSKFQMGRSHENRFVVSCWHHGIQFDLWTVDFTRTSL
jgi:hypothetical protein